MIRLPLLAREVNVYGEPGDDPGRGIVLAGQSARFVRAVARLCMLEHLRVIYAPLEAARDLTCGASAGSSDTGARGDAARGTHARAPRGSRSGRSLALDHERVDSHDVRARLPVVGDNHKHARSRGTLATERRRPRDPEVAARRVRRHHELHRPEQHAFAVGKDDRSQCARCRARQRARERAARGSAP